MTHKAHKKSPRKAFGYDRPNTAKKSTPSTKASLAKVWAKAVQAASSKKAM